MSIYSLSRQYKEAYSAISAAMDSLQLNAHLPIISAEEALSIYNKVISENRNGYFYKPVNVRILKSIMGTTLYMTMCPEAEKRISFCCGVEFEIEDIISVAAQERAEYDKILRVYKYFIDQFRYVQTNTENEKYHMTASPFLYREAVCEGFALAFSAIMNRLCIPCGIVSGTSTLNNMRGPHAWNIIYHEGNYYHIDVTWDICTKEKGHFFDYFLLDDKLVRRDHHWDDNSIPRCIDPSKDFYAKKRMICYSASEAIGMLHEQIELKKRAVGFRFLGDHVESIINNKILSRILAEAMRQTCQLCSQVQYGYNAKAGTAYFNIIY